MVKYQDKHGKEKVMKYMKKEWVEKCNIKSHSQF